MLICFSTRHKGGKIISSRVKSPNSNVGLRTREVLQGEALIPGGVEATFDGLGLLLALTLGIWDQLELDVGV